MSFEILNMGQGLQKSFLHNILGLNRILQQTKTQAIDPVCGQLPRTAVEVLRFSGHLNAKETALQVRAESENAELFDAVNEILPPDAATYFGPVIVDRESRLKQQVTFTFDPKDKLVFTMDMEFSKIRYQYPGTDRPFSNLKGRVVVIAHTKRVDG